MTRPNRNTFDLSHDVKMSMSMGLLYPVCVLEAVPGDVFRIGCQSLIRMAPMIAPVMHRMNAFVHYFFVANRLTWDGWEDWISNEASVRVHPTLSYNDFLPPLYDYLGLPASSDPANDVTVSALPMAAYQMIYNEYYRDQNLIDEVEFELVDGDNADNADLPILRRRAWMHDYFTSALPFPQKGAEVIMPNSGDIPVYVNHNLGLGTIEATPVDIPQANLVSENPDIITGTLYANTSNLTAPNINDLRRAIKMQEWLERNARGGTRYTEVIRMHFGVVSPDARMQRPEYITGIKTPIVISEVLNTTGEDGGLPQGNQAGHGIAAMQGKYGKYYCYEHGYIIGIMSVTPLPAYQQGVPKHFLKYDDKFKHYWNSFAHIGEQEIEQQEIYAGTATPKAVFGYTPRYAEYKYTPSRVSGEFRTTLAYWHLGRIFENTPVLNQEFIECNPDNRIFAVTNTETMYVHFLNKITASRLMPRFGTPSI